MTAMTTRRQFLGLTAGGTAGLVGLGATRLLGGGLAPAGRSSTTGPEARLTAAVTAPTTEVNQFFSRPDLRT